MRIIRMLVWVAVAAGLLAVVTGAVEAAYVFAPLLGLVIYRIGMATFGSLRRGASYIPDGPPQPVDVERERTVYWCQGCGAEVLLLVRGTDTAPRHCGEKMVVRTEVARESLN